MDVHKNARSCPASRELLFKRVSEQEWSVRAASEAVGMSDCRGRERLRRAETPRTAQRSKLATCFDSGDECHHAGANRGSAPSVVHRTTDCANGRRQPLDRCANLSGCRAQSTQADRRAAAGRALRARSPRRVAAHRRQAPGPLRRCRSSDRSPAVLRLEQTRVRVPSTSPPTTLHGSATRRSFPMSASTRHSVLRQRPRLVRSPRCHRRSSDHGERISLRLASLRRLLSVLKHQTSANQTTPSSDQRQSRAVHTDPASRMGLPFLLRLDRKNVLRRNF